MCTNCKFYSNSLLVSILNCFKTYKFPLVLCYATNITLLLKSGKQDHSQHGFSYNNILTSLNQFVTKENTLCSVATAKPRYGEDKLKAKSTTFIIMSNFPLIPDYPIHAVVVRR